MEINRLCFYYLELILTILMMKKPFFLALFLLVKSFGNILRMNNQMLIPLNIHNGLLDQSVPVASLFLITAYS